MKGIVLTILTSVIVVVVVKGQGRDSLYAVTYTVGPLWDINKSPNDQPYFKEHSARLGELRKNGVIKAGARFGEKGLIVITATSLNAAKEIIVADVAVITKLFNVEVEKLNVFYDGCLERPK